MPGWPSRLRWWLRYQGPGMSWLTLAALLLVIVALIARWYVIALMAGFVAMYGILESVD